MQYLKHYISTYVQDGFNLKPHICWRLKLNGLYLSHESNLLQIYDTYGS